jgi:hypothetical protein
VEDDGSLNAIKKAVGVHSVTKLTQTPDKSPPGPNKGPSGVAAAASQGRVGLWKSHEEEELKSLVSIHTDSKGTVSWVKVVETWNSLELPTRTKASLSSKCSDIKSRATVLNSIQEKGNNELCTTPKFNASQQPTDVIGIQVVNKAVKSTKTKSPVVTGINIPLPVKKSLNPVNTGNSSEMDFILLVF